MKTKNYLLLLLILLFSIDTQSQISLCPSPTGLSTSAIGFNTATLSWTGNSSSYGYKVRYRPVLNPAAPWLQSGTQGTSLVLNNLICNSAYEWQVQSVCGNSTTNTSVSAYVSGSNFTTLACPTNTCPVPTSLTSTNVTANSAVLSWTSSGATLFNIRYRIVNPNVPVQWVSIVAQSSSVTLNNLQCNNQYEWQVQAKCMNGTSIGAVSAFSSSSFFTTLTCPATCPVPTNLSSTNITANSAALSWNSTGAILYNVRYRAVNPSTPSQWLQVTTQSNTLVLQNLLCNKQYEWQVQAKCLNSTTSGSVSAFSPSAFFTTSACPAVCPVPTGLTVSNVTANGASLSWNPVAGVLGYLLSYRPVTTINPINWIQVTVQGNSLTLANLLCNTTYQWQVRAKCGTSTNAASLSAIVAGPNFTTLACPIPNCATPSGLNASNITTNAASLSWNSTGAIGYIVRYQTANSLSWLTVNTNTNSLQLTNLAPGRTYNWQVRSVCGNSTGTAVSSPWSPTANFTTNTILITTFPNPAGSLLNIPLSLPVNDNVRVELRNSQGNIVLSRIEQLSAGQQTLSLDTEKVPDGYYFLHVTGTEFTEYLTVLIRH